MLKYLLQRPPAEFLSLRDLPQDRCLLASRVAAPGYGQSPFFSCRFSALSSATTTW